MKKRTLQKILLTRESLYRLGLALFGFTLCPGIVFLITNIFTESHSTIPELYSEFYRSLLNLGLDGLYSWGVACTPYMAYDIYLIVKSYKAKKIEIGNKDF